MNEDIVKLQTENKKLRAENVKLNIMAYYAPEIIECGEYRDFELVQRHGEHRDLPKNYKVILIKE